MKKDFTFIASDNEKIAVSTYGAPDFERCAIYVHGFKGFKDWGFVPYIGEYLAKRRIFTVTFNFSHNGIGENPLEFTEMDKFAANTFSREIRELSEIIAACDDGSFGGAVFTSVGLLGHSRGGAIAYLTAAYNENVKAAVTWASVATVDRYSEQTRKKWREAGYLEVINMRTHQVMRLNTTLLDDVEKHGADKLNIEKAVKSMNKPLLIIHGEADESVPNSEADLIFEWADKSKSRILKIPATGHAFDSGHPFKGSTPKLDLVLNESAQFFYDNLPPKK